MAKRTHKNGNDFIKWLEGTLREFEEKHSGLYDGQTLNQRYHCVAFHKPELVYDPCLCVRLTCTSDRQLTEGQLVPVADIRDYHVDVLRLKAEEMLRRFGVINVGRPTKKPGDDRDVHSSARISG